jgi:alkyl sulfatase BDS1-like metallo-beta-lactamase superfamily hydrolase
MTIPFFVEDPTQFHRPMVQVPQDIVMYCDAFTVDADREDLRYIDCVWMHLGYYGTPAHVMKAVREEYYDSIMTNLHQVKPIFE